MVQGGRRPGRALQAADVQGGENIEYLFNQPDDYWFFCRSCVDPTLTTPSSKPRNINWKNIFSPRSIHTNHT